MELPSVSEKLMTLNKTDSDPFRILVLGGGTAGWMAANLMAKRWADRDVEITVLEAPDIGIIGVGEGSTPQLKAFFDTLDIAEADWMAKCNATYKNGISFHGWSERPGHAHYFHPFPSPIDHHTSPAFYFHSHFRRQGIDLNADPDRFFLSAHLANNRLAPKPNHNFPFDIAYGYHFDSHLVGAFLREHAKSLDVVHAEGKAVDVQLTPDGNIASLKLDDGQIIEADFFIDSTGFRSVLLQQALGVKFVSFAENLFNNAAVVLPTPADPDGTNSQTTSTALKNGWAWNIPLTNRTGNGYVYSDKYCSSDEAETELRAHLGMLDSDVAARHLKMKVGRVEKHWRKNCLAVGLSQGFIEPLEATALHLVQATIEQFMAAFEGGGFTNQKEDAFNADINARFEGVRDYIVCHYRANLRTDTQYWRDNAANNKLSDTLHRIFKCWFERGDMKQEIVELGISKYYSLTSWLCLLGGYGNYPGTDKLKPPPDDLQRFDLSIIDDFVARAGLNFRDHKTVLAEMRERPGDILSQ
jgi:2-polyprenyl-6-methoxyphenol hydroxylase-like FAD-dependent oxidoreductase